LPDAEPETGAAAQPAAQRPQTESPLSTDTQNTRDRAEARFDRLQRQKREGEAAAKDYEAQSKSVDAKTARLKALRLAKEAADAEAAAAAPPKPAKAAKTTKKRATRAAG
jgi:hypothetical protein